RLPRGRLRHADPHPAQPVHHRAADDAEEVRAQGGPRHDHRPDAALHRRVLAGVGRRAVGVLRPRPAPRARQRNLPRPVTVRPDMTLPIYALHENPEWFPPFAKAFADRGVEVVEWVLTDGVLDLDSAPPEGI